MSGILQFVWRLKVMKYLWSSSCGVLALDDEASEKIRLFVWRLQAMEHLESFISDCDRKVEIQKRKLKETQEELSDEATSKVGQ